MPHPRGQDRSEAKTPHFIFVPALGEELEVPVPPKVIDDDSLLFARALQDRGLPVPQIARKLTIKAGENAGKYLSVASLYRALADAEEHGEPAEAPAAGGRRPVRARISGPGSVTDPELMDRLTRQVLGGTANDDIVNPHGRQTLALPLTVAFRAPACRCAPADGQPYDHVPTERVGVTLTSWTIGEPVYYGTQRGPARIVHRGSCHVPRDHTRPATLPSRPAPS